MSLVYPEYRDMDLFVVNEMKNAFREDGNSNIRPMTYYVEKPSSIGGLFDGIAYSKCKL